jgi:hypothetical protein
MNLDGLEMYVSATAENGVVGSDTRLRLAQRGSTVFGRYAGGSVLRGCLIGTLDGDRLAFRYLQLEVPHAFHGGSSVCEVQRRADGRIRLVEHFVWRTRRGSGTNVFDEVPIDGDGADCV